LSDQLQTGKFIMFAIQFGKCYKYYVLHLSTLFYKVEVSYFVCMCKKKIKKESELLFIGVPL